MESRVGEGTTFFFKIPLKVADNKETIRIKASHKINAQPRLKNKRILVVEDDAITQLMMASLLDKFEVPYEIATDGETAVSKVLTYQPDLILMDMHLPKMSGLEATRQIREFPAFKLIPIIALTADAFVNQKNEALLVGMTDYLTKPINIGMLLSVLNTYLLDEE